MRIALPRFLSPAAFAGLDPAAPIVALHGETMGTTWRVRLVPPARPDAVRVLHAAIAARLAGLVDEMSHWEAGSALSRFNRLGAGAWAALPPDFARVIAAALAIAAQSEGRFDPTLGHVVDLRGFGPRPAGPVDEAAVAAAHRRAGWRRLRFDAPARRLYQPGGLALDLSGIAKGYAVDAVAALLRDAGVRHALVEIGGELVGLGVRPDGDPWWVDLEVPPGVALPPLRVALHGLAVATSGDYAKGAHTLDPATGRSLGSGAVSTSVVHDNAMAADAWATALGVAGPDGFMALATRHALAARLIAVRDGRVTELLSPALAAMLAD